MSASRVLSELKRNNPNIVISGSSNYDFSLDEFDIFYECEILSIWDPLSQPIGKRRGNKVVLVDNTYFSTISHHLIQHMLVENLYPKSLDTKWASVGVMKKVITECMYLKYPSHTAIALMIEYLMEFETLNIDINKNIRKNKESEELIKLSSRACTASSSHHELGHFLYANKSFRDEYFCEIETFDIPENYKVIPQDWREEIFCDSFGLFATVVELVKDGYDWRGSFELAKVSLYGSHMTLLCQLLANDNLALNEPDSSFKEADISAKIQELDFRFESAVNHANSRLIKELKNNKGTKVSIPFLKNSFVEALQEASNLRCRDLGIRRISGLLAKAFMKENPLSFSFVVNNSHQFTNTGEFHSFDSLKT